jgi:TonB family protein
MLSKTLLILSIIIISSIHQYSQNAWNKEVLLQIEEKPLRYILNEIRSQTNLNLIYNDKQTREIIVTCNLNTTAEEAISKVLIENGFSYKKYENNSAVIYKNKSPQKYITVVHDSRTENDISVPKVEITKPTLLSKVELNYPQEAIDKNIEGEVLAKILVTSKGNVSKVILETSSGYKILDTVTYNYVRKLKFLPAEHNGKYLQAWTTLLVKYAFE